MSRPLADAHIAGRRRPGRFGRQLVLQLICIAIAVTVLFPMVWILAMSLDPRNISRPDSLFPPGASLDAYARVIARPTLNPVSFARLALNSVIIALLISAASVSIGVLAAYAFSRLRFRGREILMIAILAVLMLPAVAALAPLFVMLGKFQFGTFNLRSSLFGVALAVTASQLPFAIWNIKGYLDTIPKELEEAATVDGAGRFQAFRYVILPLATPVLAVTAFFGFIAGWTEFQFSFLFLVGDTNLWTLSMALNGMVGQYAASTPWSQFAAFAILVALPVMVVYMFLQRYIVSGLAIGGVKG
ncbi:MAG: ABC transporter permease subunit [Chloroflexi bacterium]|nr:ABC transporter permease subunit [Chloroflexota bacterium]